MIIDTENGDIFAGNEKRIAFAVNTKGINDASFTGVITEKYWSELANIGETKIGMVLTKTEDYKKML